MNKTKIEWVKNPDGTQAYTWNPITGCLNHINGMCKGGNFPCYAYGIANGRVRNLYLANKNWDTRTPEGYEGYPNLDPFYPRFWHERMAGKFSYYGKKKQGIFVCDMSDMFGIGIPEQWTRDILKIIDGYPQHRFYLLTKQPQNLPQWSPFPDHCYVGVTVCNDGMMTLALTNLANVEAKVRYLSIEPQLGFISMKSHQIKGIVDWIILGALTGTKQELLSLKAAAPLTLMPYGKKWTLQPNPRWVHEIICACREAGIPYFLKDNLRKCLPIEAPYYRMPGTFIQERGFSYKSDKPVLIQEMPRE